MQLLRSLPSGVAKSEDAKARNYPEGFVVDPSYAYQALAARRVSYDQMLWQVPAISPAAQAVLVGASLGDQLAVWPRLALLVMALGIGYLSLQLMAKQKFHEQVDINYLRA